MPQNSCPLPNRPSTSPQKIPMNPRTGALSLAKAGQAVPPAMPFLKVMHSAPTTATIMGKKGSSLSESTPVCDVSVSVSNATSLDWLALEIGAFVGAFESPSVLEPAELRSPPSAISAPSAFLDTPGFRSSCCADDEAATHDTMSILMIVRVITLISFPR